MTWGKDLWDQRDIIEKHTHNGIDFIDKCASFVKERIRVEQEYAKSLSLSDYTPTTSDRVRLLDLNDRQQVLLFLKDIQKVRKKLAYENIKTSMRLVKAYQFKKKEEDDLPYTYQHAFKAFLQETDDFAGQREVISEEMHTKILKEMHKLSSDSKSERKKAISALNDHKNHLEQIHKAMQQAKSRYERASEDANVAFKAYEASQQSLDLTKAQIMKFQKTSQDKGSLADKAREEYNTALDNFNKSQTLYYEADFPNTVNNELQKPEENRLQKLAGYFKESAAIHKKVLPIISKCLEGMDNAGESIDPSKDSSTLIERHQTGEHPPGNVPFEEWGKPANNSHVHISTPTQKSKVRSSKSVFGLSSKKKEHLTSDTVANDYAELPPAQRRKKFLKTIAAYDEQINQTEKTITGMQKMKDTSKQFGGDMASIQENIASNEKELKRLKDMKYQYQCYLEAMDGTGSKNNSRPSSTVTDGPPPVQKPPELGEPPKQQQEEQTPSSPGQYPADEFDDEVRCSALYDFAGHNEGELTISAGEELIVVEDDDGSGWTCVSRGDGEQGFVPTSYIQKQ